MMSNKNGNEKYICVCGSSITNQRINISQHEKTKLHLKYLENKKPEIKITENKITEIKNNLVEIVVGLFLKGIVRKLFL